MLIQVICIRFLQLDSGNDMSSSHSDVLLSLEAVFNNFSSSSFSLNYLNVMPISVVICGTTDLLAEIVRDRFMRCLHRLRSLYLYHHATASSRCIVCKRLPGMGVVPGAGLPELLTAMQLRQVRENWFMIRTIVLLSSNIISWHWIWRNAAVMLGMYRGF